ncbi:MAG: AMP-binding protein [Phenylobacterium sp.]|uniref:AMP-binding protein n=1 Tax=Phenylobacterium sp. TaxID=1871053 RepID=UPI0027358A45|nr:AMP-binding protein [Phenylobacterium sp.]MDP3750014.1 AMP-binding protein [Phenylobacterium sp.]
MSVAPTDPLHDVAPIAAFFDRAIRRFADRECIVDGERRYTYRQFGDEVSRYIQVFKAYGLRRGDGIALLSGNRVEAMFVVAAAQFIGLRYVALHPLSKIDEHIFVLDDAEITALVLDANDYPEQARLRPGELKVFTFDAFDAGIDISAHLPEFEPQDLVVEADGGELNWLYYTGGTTGRPKGVLMSHRMAVTNMMNLAAEREWPEAPRYLMASPISHAGGFNAGPVMLKGGAMIIIARFDPLLFLETVEKEQISAIVMVPTLLYSVLDHPRLKDFDLSSLKLIMYGSAPISPQRLEQAIKAFGPIFGQFYGQSECGPISYLAAADHDLSKPHRLQSCGLPIAGKQVKVMNANNEEVAVGDVGEICVRGPGVTDGYWKRPGEAEKVFAAGWLHTGDLAKRDAEGYLYIVGRAKDMVVTGGFNVYPKEVEDTIGQHPAVAICAVIGVPHERWGEAVTAFVVLKAGETATEAELIALVKDKRGAVQAPKTVHFVDDLPLTGYQKVDKVALRKPFWAAQERQVG